MNHVVPSVLAVALLCAAGCNRRPAPVAPHVQSSSPSTPAPTTSAPGADVALPKELQASTPAVAQMNLAVQEFVVQMGRPPARLEELVEQKVLPRLLDPAPGMKFVLTKGKNNQPQVAEVRN